MGLALIRLVVETVDMYSYIRCGRCGERLMVRWEEGKVGFYETNGAFYYWIKLIVFTAGRECDN